MSSVFLLLVSALLSIAASYAPSKAAAGWNDLAWDFGAKEMDVKVVGNIPSWLNGSLFR